MRLRAGGWCAHRSPYRCFSWYVAFGLRRGGCVDDDRHAHIVKRDKRGRGQNLEFDAEFEKFYAEEKVDIVDQSDEQV